MRISLVPPPLAKRLKRFLRFWLLRALLGILSALPLALAQRLGDIFGGLVFRVAKKEREKAVASLTVAFPELSHAERLALAEKTFRHLGRCALELACARRILPQLESFMEWPAADRACLEAVLARGRGVVFVTGHIGNWELMGWRVALAGFPVRAVAKELSDLRLTALAGRFRAQGGVQSIWRGHQGAVRQILKALKAGELLTLLIDQDTRVQNVFVPFFGKLAATPRAAADFALRTGATPMVAWCHRKADGHYQITMKEVAFESSGDGGLDALALTAALTRELEGAIRAAPEQWVWMHQRWKTMPGTV